MVIEDLLNREDYMIYDTEEVYSIHYAEVCAAYGAARIAGLENDKATLNKLQKRYAIRIADSIGNTENHVDVNVYGILPLELFMHGADSSYYYQGISLADGQWDGVEPGELSPQVRFWIDDVWMIGSLQVQAYLVTGQQKYLDRAALVAAAYLDKLQQPNGLFYHGENAPFYWGRGNGWMAAGFTIIISELNEDHAAYDRILAGYKKMMESLLKYQAGDGMWRQLVDIDTAWKETSSTAMFGYAIQTGLNNKLLDESVYAPASDKAWNGLMAYLQENGKISDVCVGTGQSRDVNYYLDRPTVSGDFHGQAPLLWFAQARMAK